MPWSAGHNPAWGRLREQEKIIKANPFLERFTTAKCKFLVHSCQARWSVQPEEIEQFLDVASIAQRMLMRRPMIQGSCLVPARR
jgi:hypothetical protein